MNLRHSLWATGAVALIGLVLLISGRAATAPSFPAPGTPLVLPDPNAPSGPATAQPVAIQSLDATHFVVVTREPRLVTRVGGDGRFVNMILYVVTHYTVQNGKLVPVEHVHVPQGWRPLGEGD